MQDVYRQPAVLPLEPAPAVIAVVAPPRETVATTRRDDADELSFVREGPYDEGALDGVDRLPTRWVLVLYATLFLGTLGTFLMLMAPR